MIAIISIDNFHFFLRLFSLNFHFLHPFSVPLSVSPMKDEKLQVEIYEASKKTGVELC